MAQSNNGGDDPDPRTEDSRTEDPSPPDNRGARLIKVWVPVRTGLQLVELMAGQHEGLHLTAQALIYVGDATVAILGGTR